jgi:hypothetical protein
MARQKNQRKGSGKKVYSIIVDGETEVWYFQMMKRHEDLPKIDVKPELPKRKKLKEQFEAVLENAKLYDKVFWIVDFDTIIKEDKEAKKGTESALQAFLKYLKTLSKYRNVAVYVNNPCLEFWYLLHFEATSRYFPQCETVEKLLQKNHLTDYEKSQKYYTKRDNDIYKKLKPLQQEAIKNAAKLGDFEFDNPQLAKAEMYQIFESLGI